MNSKLDSIDDIEILDDFDDQPTPSSDNIKRQVDETVRSQLSAFANHRPYNSTYTAAKNIYNEVNKEPVKQEVDEFNEYLYNNSHQAEQPVMSQEKDDFTPKEEPEIFEFNTTPSEPTMVQANVPTPEVVPEPVVNSTPEKPTSLEKTMTIPELEKTAVYPSGVIPIENNEPVDDSDSANKSKKALIFIIGLFVLLAVVIFVVLPLINPV